MTENDPAENDPAENDPTEDGGAEDDRRTIRLPIPPVFHSLELDGPFRHCLICERELLGGDCWYMIERIFRGAEPILEYAMCNDCHAKQMKEISAESNERIQAFFLDRWDLEQLMRRSIDMFAEPEVESLIGRCLLTGTPAGECHERQIYARCRGEEIWLEPSEPVFPMMLSGAVIDDLSEVLSEATKGWLDDFVGENFGLSPDFADNPDWTPVLL